MKPVSTYIQEENTVEVLKINSMQNFSKIKGAKHFYCCAINQDCLKTHRVKVEAYSTVYISEIVFKQHQWGYIYTGEFLLTPCSTGEKGSNRKYFNVFFVNEG
ncbi:LOW QUALITY PROTEIN: hypothetical protein MXB_394 [Myxobolus squamalis]|nr:LOW QUALITY PROTEIN: hypothetical protein MXB_394 [Myxobolus squamalis]